MKWLIGFVLLLNIVFLPADTASAEDVRDQSVAQKKTELFLRDFHLSFASPLASRRHITTLLGTQLGDVSFSIVSGWLEQDMQTIAVHRKLQDMKFLLNSISLQMVNSERVQASLAPVHKLGTKNVGIRFEFTYKWEGDFPW